MSERGERGVRVVDAKGKKGGQSRRRALIIMPFPLGSLTTPWFCIQGRLVWILELRADRTGSGYSVGVQFLSLSRRELNVGRGLLIVKLKG